jgi:hypothetical protein
MSKTIITHKHHIIPKHMGGTDDPSNLVELTVEEHAEAHRVLYEKYGRRQDYFAWKGLAGLMGKEEIQSQLVKETLGKKCVSPEGVVYASLSEAARHFRRCPKTIRLFCNTNRYGWYWEEDLGKPPKPIKKRRTFKKRCVSPEGVMYPSLAEAARQLRRCPKTIRHFCTINKNGWYWEDSPPTNSPTNSPTNLDIFFA